MHGAALRFQRFRDTDRKYACGITPYDATHIGHAATYTAWDLLVRAWLDAGHEVVYTQNITDVDDPLLERAERDGEDWWQLALREIDRFRGDMEALRNLPPTYYIGAVEAIPIIDKFTERLAAKGALYDLDGDIYFARAADHEFGALAGPGTPSGLSIAEMTELSAERGGDPGRPGKKDPLDPLVWRAKRPAEPSWASRFGPGRPGWHVECAAIAAEYLGPSFDVQAGGSDLVFPHHEMSASHARVACAPGDDGHVFARIYAHSGMVSYQGAKMSKSLGNLVFVSRLRAAAVDPMAIRLALLAHHYRMDWEWTDAVLAEARHRLDRWRAAVARAVLTRAVPIGAVPTGAVPTGAVPTGAGAVPAAQTVLATVRERLADDLDAPGAVAAIDAWADAVLESTGLDSTGLGDAGGAAPEDAALIRDTADALLGVAL
jgi:L-cysteine:1D-myo-inositol 2-amino-2-deoxy-alpha-D-glucopyranoside ligase